MPQVVTFWGQRTPMSVSGGATPDWNAPALVTGAQTHGSVVPCGPVDTLIGPHAPAHDELVTASAPVAVPSIAAMDAPASVGAPVEVPGAYVLPAPAGPTLDEGAARPTATDMPWTVAVRHLAEPHGGSAGYGLFGRVAVGVVGIVLAVRLVYDDLLPRIVGVVALASTVLLGLAMTLRAVAEARRQRSLLVALAHLTRMCNTDVGMRSLLAPQVDAVVTALRAEPRVWPWPHGHNSVTVPSHSDPARPNG